MNQTTVTAVGSVITPVQIRHLPDGTPVTTFRIACNERRFDRDANAWIDRDSFFVSVTCWRRLAENVCRSLRSGDPVVVRGRLLTRSYDTADGRRNSVTELEADVVAPDLVRCTAVVTRTRRVEQAATVAISSGAGGGPEPQVADGAPQDRRADDPWSEQRPASPEGGGEERRLVEAVPAAGH